MGRKAKPGMRVDHTRSGFSGKILGVDKHTLWVRDDYGGIHNRNASEWSKSGGCAVVGLVLLAGLGAAIGFAGGLGYYLFT